LLELDFFLLDRRDRIRNTTIAATIDRMAAAILRPNAKSPFEEKELLLLLLLLRFPPPPLLLLLLEVLSPT
jgi:hypothetical protein